MPTMGRLVGAILFAILGYYLAMTMAPLFEEGRVPGFWYPMCVVIGIWAGWFVVGRKAGLGYRAGIGIGLTGVAAQLFWMLFILSFGDMLTKSMRRSYDGPVEAIVNVFEIVVEYVVQFATYDVVVATIGGAIICGLITEFFGRRYP